MLPYSRLSKTEFSVSFLQFRNVPGCCIALVLVAPKGVSTLFLFAETLHDPFVSYTSTVNFTLRICCWLACHVNSVLEGWHASQIISIEKLLYFGDKAGES